MRTAGEFPSKRQFIVWMMDQSECTPSIPRRIALDYEPVTWAVKAEVLDSEGPPAWAVQVVEIPLPKAALGRLWDSIQDQNLCLYFLHEGKSSGAIVVAARAGVWKSLDERSLVVRKDLFREILHDEARLLVGEHKAWSGLSAEVQLFGIGCRILAVGHGRK